MYGYLLDCPDQDTVQPRFHNGAETDRSHDVFMSRYQRERRRVYDRAQHMVRSAGYGHADVEDAKAEAALVREQAKVSRARGGRLGWVKHMLRRGSAARFGYRNPTEMVASRLDARRSAARDLVFLAERLGDDRIERIRQGAVLAEAGAWVDVIERSREADLESVKRVLQAHRRMSRHQERELFDSQYLALQPSLDGSHVQLRGRLGALEAEICRQGLGHRGERLLPAGEMPVRLRASSSRPADSPCPWRATPPRRVV